MNEINLVVKIGSMALIQKAENEIDYNIFQRLGGDLRPGMILVTSGAAEIGRLDYMHRAGHELGGITEEDKADYAAQGQTILMNTYRQFVRPEYGIRQVLVEHNHFNDPLRREHIRRLLTRAAGQGVIPIINYNDPVSDEEVRKMELASRRAEGAEVVECVDNDETAEVVASLVGAKNLILLTSTEGIYLDRDDPSTLVKLVSGSTLAEVRTKVSELMGHCSGASRKGANGARAKLAFALRAVEHGTNVIIGHARYHIADLLAGRVPCTRLGVNVEENA
ncbi:MAG: uridylate kinase [Clostridia bacterium]|nr:uridylate kinase [Clostridia bacterium]